MNVLMMVTWYSPMDAETIQAGIFHYEQSVALQKYCNMALYFPSDTTLKEDYHEGVERGLLTFRTRKTANRISSALRVFKDFKRIRKAFAPDIIHAHCAMGAGFYAVLLGKIYGIPVVLTEHTRSDLGGYDQGIAYHIAHFVYRRTRFNACVSKCSREEARALFPDCRFHVVYNGIIRPEVRNKETSYRKEGFVNVAIVAAFYSEWIKGYQYLLPAIQKLKEEGEQILLHIVGGGTFLKPYQKLAGVLDIEDRCIFYGSCDRQKVYDIVSQMDFCTSVSLTECSGVSVEEAMLLGKPLLVTKSGGADSLVTGETAIVIEKGSTQAIIDGMKRMIRHLPQFDSEKIHKYALKNFEIDRISRKYYLVYKRILKNNEQ